MQENETVDTVTEMTQKELDAKLEAKFLEGQLKAEREIKGRMPQITVKEQEPKNLFGYAFRAVAKAKKENVSVISVIDSWQKNEHRPEGEVLKNMNTQELANGGFYLSQALSNEIIPALRNQTVIRKAGASNTSLIDGSLLMRTEGNGAIAYWTGEGSALTQSTITGNQMKISSNRLGTFVVINNKLLEYANPTLEAEVQQDLIYALSAKEDVTFLRGGVAQYAPTGILNLIDSGNKFNANGTVSVANVVLDLGKAVYKLRTANIPMYRPAILISPRTEYYLTTVRDTNGFVFKDEMANGKIYGMPYFVSNYIPDNLGIGSNESEIYVGDFAQALIGDNGGMNIQVVPGGTYHSNGSAVSGLLTGETVIASEMDVAFGIKYAKAFSVIQAVKWGA